ncbi:TPA: helix-turn-helix domain-containing protein [Escherichia coli]
MNRFLTLLAIEGYTQREIARKMHCSQNTIFKRLIKIKYFSKMVVKKIFSLPTHCLRIGR